MHLIASMPLVLAAVFLKGESSKAYSNRQVIDFFWQNRLRTNLRCSFATFLNDRALITPEFSVILGRNLANPEFES
jgi:hypothetical protein